MQFRERRRVIQIIRTTYDPALKRGRSKVVGRIPKDAAGLSDKLSRGFTEAEIDEIDTWLRERNWMLVQEAVRLDVDGLAGRMRLAADYFRDHNDAEAAETAAEIRDAWDELKKAMQKSGFGKNNVRSKVGAGSEDAPVAQQDGHGD